MKSLVLFSYKQPVDGSKFRWGVLTSKRDTVKHPVSQSYYRFDDPNFKRSKTLSTVLTTDGPRAFYSERSSWMIKIPFIGSLVARFLPAS
jgi:hypothetical protein